MELSIVSTIYNDAALVQSLCDKIIEHVKPLTTEFEIILVDDGSSDNSANEIAHLCASNKNVKAVFLSRNYGQQVAMTAGMQLAAGNWVVIMDGDLQNPPEAIPELYAKINEGYDIVYTISTARNGWRDALSSFIFWWFLSRVFRVKVVPHQLMMKIMSQKFLERFNSYSERSRTIIGIVNDIGQKHANIKVKNNKRLKGKSHYGFFKRFQIMIDILIGFSKAPLNLLIYLGLFILGFTCIFSGYKIYQYLFFHILPGYTSTILALFFFGSLNLLALGFIGRYIANIYAETQQRPLFHIERKINF